MNRLHIAPARLPETMARLAYFHGWPQEVLARLAAGTRLVTLAKNEPIGRKGQTPQSLHVVVSGLVRVFLPLPNEVERVVSLAGKGDSFGEACLLLQQPCPYDAVAGQDSHLLAVDAMLFRQETARNLDLTRQVLERVSRHFMESLRDTEICARRSSVERVAGYLLQHQPKPDAQEFHISLPARKQDVAAKLGLTQETFSRVLSALDKQGLIQVMGKQIHVEDGRKLSQLSAPPVSTSPSGRSRQITI